MHVTTQCNHRHHVTILLGEAETFDSPGYGEKTIRVERVNVGVEPGKMPTEVSIAGCYLKKDGTPGRQRVSYPPRLRVKDLPEMVRVTLEAAVQGMVCDV